MFEWEKKQNNHTSQSSRTGKEEETSLERGNEVAETQSAAFKTTYNRCQVLMPLTAVFLRLFICSSWAESAKTCCWCLKWLLLGSALEL